MYEVAGLLDTADLLTLAALDLPALKDPVFHPVTPPRLAAARNIFDVIREGDILLHHPYDSFQTTVERFIQTAAEDPDVLAIKLTLYRTGGDSSIARLLAQAAERGKQVAVLIELQARFDEENNIIWAQRLEDVGRARELRRGRPQDPRQGDAGGPPRGRHDAPLRAHRHRQLQPQDGAALHRLRAVHRDPELGADLTDLFNVLTGFASPPGYRKLIVAPRGMRERFLTMIRREIAHQRRGGRRGSSPR